MEKETTEGQEPTSVQDTPIEESQADADFAAAATIADDQVARDGDQREDKAPKPPVSGDEGTSGKDGADKGDRDGEPKPGSDADKADKGEQDKDGEPENPKTEAEKLAAAQREAEDRAMLAEQAERKRQDDAAAAQKQAQAPLDVAAVSKTVAEALKGVKIEGYETFADFEKEYGSSLTQAMTAVSLQIARSMVAPIVQQMQQERQAQAHGAFIGQIKALGHTDVDTIEGSDEFWGWLDKPENANLKFLVERADVKGTDMVLRAYKTEKGIKTSVPKTDRESLVEKQRQERDRADALHTTTGRRQAPPAERKGDPADIKDEEDAEKAFNDAVNEQDDKFRRQRVR